jgi:predicted negative regulator of RcsB-dependent stress response
VSRARLLACAALVPGAAMIGATSLAPPLPEGTTPVVAVRLPGFAAELAQRAPLGGASAWTVMPEAEAWRRLSSVRAAGRQSVRWDYARSLIAGERGAEALGVLDVMHGDDPDLGMVDAYRLARGAALTQLGRADEALAALDMPGLRTNPEACLWRMRALAQGQLAEQALQQLGCAASALGSPRGAPFVLAAARAGIEGGAPDKALHWLSWLPDRDPAANLLRGRAQLALGHGDEARLRFARVAQSGTPEQRMDARLSEIEGQVAAKAITPDVARRQLDAIRYAWRGDAIEERALRLSYRLADEGGDLPGALAAGAAMVRYHDPARQGADFLPSLRAKLIAALDPARKLPLDRAAGLYWDYRDLAPAGAGGDLMASRLAWRLQQAGLYERAADLLSYQLMQRAGDLARGPLSARVASLYILAGRPERALKTLRETDDPGLPGAMLGERKRVEAAALTQVGRVDEALAVLQDMPEAGALQAEILWQRREWSRYAEVSAVALPRAGRLDPVAQAKVLRHAISQVMLGREDALAGLHARYGGAFRGLPSAPVFEMLTGSAGAVDPQKLAQAMAAIPSASPAGDFADLLESVPGGKKD